MISDQCNMLIQLPKTQGTECEHRLQWDGEEQSGRMTLMGQHLWALAGGQALDRQHGRTDSPSAVGDSGQIRGAGGNDIAVLGAAWRNG